MSMLDTTKSWFKKQEQEHIRMQEIAREEMLRQSMVNTNMRYEPYHGMTNYPEQVFADNKTSRINEEIEIYVRVDDKNGNIVVRIGKRAGSTRVRILSEERDPIDEFSIYKNIEPKAIAEIAKYKYIAILKDKEIEELKRKAKIWDIKV